MSSGTKDLAFKQDRPDPIPAGSAARVLTSPITLPDISLQGATGLTLQFNYTYGAATGLTFSFVEKDSDFPSGSVLTKLDVASGVIAPFTATYTYPSLASGSARVHFPISGDRIAVTITAVGSPTASDTITLLTAGVTVFV